MNIDFRNFSKQDAIDRLLELDQPELHPLIQWIIQAKKYDALCYQMRVLITDSERDGVAK